MGTTRTWGLIAAIAVSAALPARGSLPGTPVEQWRWDGDVRDPMRNFPAGTPVVAQLTDDDGDGSIGAGDVPDVAFLHWGFGFLENAALTALRGDTGAEIFTVTDPPFSVFNTNGSPLAAADLDGDGVVELIVSSTTFGERAQARIVFEHDGTLADARPWPQAQSGGGPAVAVADLDQDGVPETLMHATALSWDGSLSWAGTSPSTSASASRFTQVADIRPDSPGLEVIVGNTCFASDGSVLWQRADLPSGATAIGDLDGDGSPEIVLTGRDHGLIHVLDPRGADACAPFPTCDTCFNETQPVLADLDGDGLPEIVVPAGLKMLALRWRAGALELAWIAPLQDGSCCADATAYDFDGDGVHEIVFRDHQAWGVLSGCDGSVLHSEPSVSATAMENPVVADIDGDPAAEIVVSGLQGVGPNLNAVVACEVPGSVRPRAIWNQKTFHVTNVEDDGGIPRVEPHAWTSPRTWHAQAAAAPGPGLSLDTASAADLFPCNLGIEVRWDAAATAAPVTYDVYRSAGAAASCADALSRPPVATGLAGTSWIDRDTSAADVHAYVVRARAVTDCAVMTADAWTEPAVADVADAAPPDVVGDVLRARHAGDEVTFAWPAARALLPGEHFHLLKARDVPTAVFSLANPESDVARAHAETDVSSRLQFFDLRVANACETISIDEFPPGR